MNHYVIFLRGVTPTGRNKVPMADLRAALDKAGLAEVRTYIQSGNVIARSPLGRGPLEALVHEVIAREIGADIQVMARTRGELHRIVAQNPFAGDDASRTYFTLLSAEPEPDHLKAFLATDFTPDRIRVMGSTLYAFYAGRYSDSRFTHAFFERRLKVVATTRNHNTMSKLVELAGGNA